MACDDTDTLKRTKGDSSGTRSESYVFSLEIHHQQWNHKLAENHWYLFNLVESITKENFTITNAIDDNKNPSKVPVAELTELQTKYNGFFLLMMNIIPFCYRKMAQNLFFSRIFISSQIIQVIKSRLKNNFVSIQINSEYFLEFVV